MLGTLEDRSVPAIFVTNASDHGPGSLRQAILDANGTPGPDSIQFDVPPNSHGLVTIVLSSDLPPLTDPVTVDGTTEPF